MTENNREKSNKIEKSKRKNKEFDELTIRDDFMFCAVMLNKGLCQKFLEMVLGITIVELEYINSQEIIDGNYNYRGVRLDVFVRDSDGNVYDIEMQTTNKKDLPQRIRFYASSIDSELLEKGCNYKELKDNIVIFICTFDYFERNRKIYRFKNLCVDDTTIELKDGAEKIVINTKGWVGEENKELDSFINYVNGGSPRNSYTTELEKEVNTIKRNKKWREAFMRFNAFRYDLLQEGREEGREEGLREGILNTIEALMDFGVDKNAAIDKAASKFMCSREYVEEVYSGKSFVTV